VTRGLCLLDAGDATDFDLAVAAYDQTVLTFSAGAIGLSLTFLEKLAPEASRTAELYASWIFFGAAILSVIVSFLLSQIAMDHEIAWLDRTWQAVERGEVQPPPRLTNRRKQWTRIVNLASGILFVLGIAMLVGFAASNWPPPTRKQTTVTKPLHIEISGEITEPVTTTQNPAKSAGVVTKKP